jgi:hypothetical protein
MSEHRLRISTPASRVGAYVIPPDANLMITRHAAHWSKSEVVQPAYAPARRGRDDLTAADTRQPRFVALVRAALRG